jgi:hypothetical protein
MPPQPPPGHDLNLLFGVLTLQLDLITQAQFADACAAWAARKDRPLADLLQERGWLSDEDRAEVERVLRRRLDRHGGDAAAGLRAASAAGDAARQTLAALGDQARQPSRLDGPAAATTDYVPAPRPPYERASACTLSAASAASGWPRTPAWAARWR